MTSYKLYYFDVRGRGELCRLILHCAGVPFEDFCDIDYFKDWPTIKTSNLNILTPDAHVFRAEPLLTFSEMPFGQVPVLEVDGEKMLAQSHTIARYLARQHGLAGQNDWEQSQADMYVDCIYDLHGGIFL